MVEQVQAAREMAERSSAAKSVFMANVSHELRTPLNGIIGAGEILETETFGQLAPQQAEFVRTVLDSGQQLLELINDIVDVARMESGQVALAPGAFDLRAMIGELESTFRDRAGEKGLAFGVELEGEVPQAVIIDGSRLRKVLSSLLDNGIKFTGQGGVDLTALGEVDARTEKCHLTFRVEDTGPGIPADQLEGIFQAFSQQEGQSINEYGGVGIGLALTRRIVESMGGTIQLHSVVGEGSSFEVVLPELPLASLESPVAQPAVKPAAEQVEKPSWSLASMEPAAAARLPELVALLEGRMTEEWEEASRGQVVNDVEALGAGAEQIGQEFEFEPLREWGERLKVQASTFQVGVMPGTLAEFSGILGQLKSVVEGA